MYELAIASAYVGTVAAAYFAPALYSAAGAAWTAAAGFAAANWPLLVGVGILFALAGAMLEFIHIFTHKHYAFSRHMANTCKVIRKKPYSLVFHTGKRLHECYRHILKL